MKKIIIIVLIIIAGLVVLSVVKDQVLNSLISYGATKSTGARVQMGGFSLGILKQSVKISNLAIDQPKGFGRGRLAVIPFAYVKADIFSLLGGKLHIPEAEFEIKELILVKNKEGKMNVDSLSVAQKKEEEPAVEKEAGKKVSFTIDLLKLKIGRVISKDYSIGEQPVIKVYEVGLNKSYKNINSQRQLIALIITEPMKAAGIRGAAIYGVSALTGVAVLPVAAAFTLFGKDSMAETVNTSYTGAFNTSVNVLKRIGIVDKADKSFGTITGMAEGCNINIKIRKISWRKVEINVSAKRLILPSPEVAGGVLYQIVDELK